MKYSSPLIISDNLKLCLAFSSIIKDLGFHEDDFKYSISKYSDYSAFKKAFSGIQIFDLKNENNVQHILSTYDIVFSLHCKQLFPSTLVDNVKCINIHPGFNPINRGWYPQVFAIIHNLPIGATIHEIDNELDHGPIIARALVDKFEHDTSETLYNRILDKEVELIKENIKQIMQGNYLTFQDTKHTENLFLKKDFNKLLEINMDEKATYREMIDRLRATSHGEYLNTYFYNTKGEKVYIKFDLCLDEKR